jgi:hypothetical protein
MRYENEEVYAAVMDALKNAGYGDYVTLDDFENMLTSIDLIENVNYPSAVRESFFALC